MVLGQLDVSQVREGQAGTAERLTPLRLMESRTSSGSSSTGFP